MKAIYEFEAWFFLYSEAVLEVNYNELPNRIAIARQAIDERREQLQLRDGNRQESQALLDALSSLHILETDAKKNQAFPSGTASQSDGVRDSSRIVPVNGFGSRENTK
ncbi:MAG TPA: hypothetical protein VGF44_13695 [Terriglobales bacterium]|jgi:hypothetical protein